MEVVAYRAKWREDRYSGAGTLRGGGDRVCRVSLFRQSNSQEIEIENEIFLKRNFESWREGVCGKSEGGSDGIYIGSFAVKSFHFTVIASTLMS